jgi:hypothetical protein
MAERCETCRFYFPNQEGQGKEQCGTCQRYAPPPVISVPGKGGWQKPQHAQWMEVNENDWCGEYQANPDAPSPTS